MNLLLNSFNLRPPAVEMAGSSVLLVGASGKLRAVHALRGSSSLTVGTVTRLCGGKHLAGTAGITVGATCVIHNFVGTADLVIGATGTLKPKAGMAGTSGLTIGTSGTLRSRSVMSGSAGLTVGATGILRRRTVLAGAVSVTVGASATLTRVAAWVTIVSAGSYAVRLVRVSDSAVFTESQSPQSLAPSNYRVEAQTPDNDWIGDATIEIGESSTITVTIERTSEPDRSVGQNPFVLDSTEYGGTVDYSMFDAYGNAGHLTYTWVEGGGVVTPERPGNPNSGNCDTSLPDGRNLDIRVVSYFGNPPSVFVNQFSDWPLIFNATAVIT